MVDDAHESDRLQQVRSCIGHRIRQRRKFLGMSLEQLGQLLNLAYQQVQKYEKGENRIGADRLPDLSRVLQVPISYFFESLSEPSANSVGLDAMRSENAALLRAYSRISDADLRQHIIALVEKVGVSA